MSIVVSHAPTKNKVQVQAKISSPPIKVLYGLKVPSLTLHIPRDGLGEMDKRLGVVEHSKVECLVGI
jgi:hypothetical protein